ncbi:MAG: hypothetical protein HYS70_00595 [Nitrospinae bacterium]|nr:hypothetical protein [Nitrospinota bacterium]
MNQKQREWLSNKLADLGNLAVLALGFGYLVTERKFGLWVPLVGLAIWGTTHVIGF